MCISNRGLEGNQVIWHRQICYKRFRNICRSIECGVILSRRLLFSGIALAEHS